ncbi:MAG: hypothetical protein GVY10_00530 [Verrucomicrobia bacterium]|jgi:hypothetical protein|nr:hypothetical protein [Verrucomicrobiota bacterium]
MKLHIPSLLTAATVLAAALLAGCGKEAASSAESETVAHTAASALLLDEAPDDAPGIHEAVQNAAPGETIVATGRIGGVMEPLSEDYAGFVLTDERVWFCDEGEDDHCPTPWDACCEDPDKLAASRFFVQFSGENGEPLLLNLREELGLAENQQVLVRARLGAAEAASGPRILEAEGLHILPGG